MISEYLLQENGVFIYVEVVSSKRRTIGLSLKAEGHAVLRAPKHFTDQDVRRFLEMHRDWLFRKNAEIKKRAEALQDYQIPPFAELRAADRRRIREKFEEKAAFYAARMGVSYGRITVRDQRSRWGSCSSKGNLNFNYRLYYLPEELLDYIVIHELAHRLHMDHSPAFWAEVAKLCPDYKKRRKMLPPLE